MNFIILGAGAIGCYVGGRLALAGQRVTFVGRPRVIDALATHGLTVTDLEGFSGHLAGTALKLAGSLREVALNDEPAVILLCVKGGATDGAAREVAQVCPAGTVIVSLQNGVDNVARVEAAAPQMQVLAGMVPYNVVFNVKASAFGQSACQAHRATMGPLQIARSAASDQFLTAFTESGLPMLLIDNMRAVQWGKLLLNLNNPVNALSELPLQAQLRNRDYRRVLADLQREALAVMSRAGITPAQVTAVKPQVLPHLLRLPNWLFTRVAARMLRMDAKARSSMSDDMQHGRVTEIDDLCGAVVRLARLRGERAPLSERMTQLVAQHHWGQPMTGLQMRVALVQSALPG